MVPVVPVAVSLFGAPLGAVPALNPVSDFASSLTAEMGTAPAPLITGISAASSVSPAPFADLVTESVGQVEKLEGAARSSIEGLMSGKGVDVHEAMIATEKADMGFELVLSVRNKALSAYQQVMGMQF